MFILLFSALSLRGVQLLLDHRLLSADNDLNAPSFFFGLHFFGGGDQLSLGEIKLNIISSLLLFAYFVPLAPFLEINSILYHCSIIV